MCAFISVSANTSTSLQILPFIVVHKPTDFAASFICTLRSSQDNLVPPLRPQVVYLVSSLCTLAYIWNSQTNLSNFDEQQGARDCSSLSLVLRFLSTSPFPLIVYNSLQWCNISSWVRAICSRYSGEVRWEWTAVRNRQTRRWQTFFKGATVASSYKCFLAAPAAPKDNTRKVLTSHVPVLAQGNPHSRTCCDDDTAEEYKGQVVASSVNILWWCEIRRRCVKLSPLLLLLYISRYVLSGKFP